MRVAGKLAAQALAEVGAHVAPGVTTDHLDQVGHIPLHQQAVVWAMRKNVDVVQLADNFFPLRYVVVR